MIGPSTGSLIARALVTSLPESDAAYSLKQAKAPTPMVIHMVSIGEETGSIETMLENVANYYEDDVQLATEQMMTMLEPAIIIVMAVIVGYMAIAIFSPMFTLYESLS